MSRRSIDGRRESETPEHLVCPICFELPENTVYQCQDGHVLCGKCYFQQEQCPTCREVFDMGRPIRCRYFEGLLGALKTDCAFKINGCGRRPTRNSLDGHTHNCCYDLERFGDFVNLCKFIGYSNCDFLVNNGNTEEFVQHLVQKHRGILTQGRIQIELPHFWSAWNERKGVWAPIILKLEAKQCFLLVCVVQIDNSVDFLSVFLPFLSNARGISPVYVEYGLSSGNNEDFFIIRQGTWTLAKVKRFLNTGLPHRLQMASLYPYLTAKGSLLINCNVNGIRQPAPEVEGGAVWEKIICPKEPPRRILSLEIDELVKIGKIIIGLIISIMILCVILHWKKFFGDSTPSAVVAPGQVQEITRKGEVGKSSAVKTPWFNL